MAHANLVSVNGHSTLTALHVISQKAVAEAGTASELS